MSGIRIPVLSKQRFEFNFLSTSATKEVVLHRALNVIPFKSGRLLLRVHDISHVGDGGFKLSAYTTAPSNDDSNEFTSATVSMQCVATSSSSAGDLVVATDSDIGPFLKIALIATQDSSSSQTLYAELSADLVVRES